MGKKKKTIKEKLLEGMTMDALLEEGYYKSSIKKAMSDLNNGYGVGKPGRKKVYRDTDDDEHIDVKFDPNTSSTNEQYEILAMSIVKFAVADLARCYIQEKKRRKDDYTAIYSSKELERWFRNESPFLTNIPPDVLIKAARLQAERGMIRNRNPKTYLAPSRDPYTTKIDTRRKEHKNG